MRTADGSSDEGDLARILDPADSDIEVAFGVAVSGVAGVGVGVGVGVGAGGGVLFGIIEERGGSCGVKQGLSLSIDTV